MANDITKPVSRALSTDMAAGLIAGIAESRASTPIAGGKPLLRLLKSGNWVYGQADDPVQDGSEWAVNPLSIKHGWSCWSDYPGNTKNELLGEVLVPVSDRKPIMPDPIGDFGWKEQRVFELKCVLGEDEGVEVLFKTSSVGGMRAVDSFFAELVDQLKKDPAHPVAIVQLEVSDYQHQKYGQIFNPVLTVVDWTDMSGEREANSNVPEPPKAPASPPPLRPGAAPRRQRPAGRV
jgi:hypothetical protein